MQHAHPISRSSGRGFSLIELMIVVVVVAILAAVVYPSFIEQVRKSRRADAITALNAIAQAQERWRANNATYNGTLTGANSLNIGNPSSGYYTLAVSGNTATAYTATATAAGAQASDAKCTALTLAMNAGTISYGKTGSGTVNQCWNR